MKVLNLIIWCCIVCFGMGCNPVKLYVSENQQAKMYVYKDTVALDIKMDSLVFRNYFVQSDTKNGTAELMSYFSNANSRFVAQYTKYRGENHFGIMRLAIVGCDYFDQEDSKYWVIINNDTIKPWNGKWPYFSYGFPYSILPEIKEGSITLYDSYLGFIERSDSLKYTMGSFIYIDKFKHEYQVCPHTLLLDSIQILQFDPHPVLKMRGEKFELKLVDHISKRKFIKSYFVHAQKKNQKMLKQLDEFHRLIED